MRRRIALLTTAALCCLGAVAGYAQPASGPRNIAWHVNITDTCNNPSFCGSTKLGDQDVYLFYSDGTFSGVRGDQPIPGDPSPVLRKITGTYHIAPGLTGMNDFFIDNATFTFLGGGGGPPTTEGPFTLNFDLGVPAVPGHYTFSEAPPPWGSLGQNPPPGVNTQVEVIQY
jgi:hypothetical protein